MEREPAFSLTGALRFVAGRAGHAIDADDFNAALGLSWLIVAVPEERDPARWPMYARDTFLVEAGRLFGMTIREVHPPEAARGLRDAAEFRQHFDASYRPLILRALEHGQSVLAWQGWPEPVDLHWGVITGTCNGGVGLSGWAPWPKEAPTRSESSIRFSQPCRDDVTMIRPPVQLYVVETITPTHPQPRALIEMALRHARRALDGSLADPFGVVAGAATFDRWAALLAEDQSTSAERASMLTSTCTLAWSIRVGLASARRFFGQHHRDASASQQAVVARLQREVEIGLAAMDEYQRTAAIKGSAPAATSNTLAASVTAAGDTVKRMKSVLCESP